MLPKFQIFLCWPNQASREITFEFKSFLEKLGPFSVFCHKEKLKLGQLFHNNLNIRLKESNFLFFIFSEQASSSLFFLYESQLIVDKDKIPIFPILFGVDKEKFSFNRILKTFEFQKENILDLIEGILPSQHATFKTARNFFVFWDEFSAKLARIYKRDFSNQIDQLTATVPKGADIQFSGTTSNFNWKKLYIPIVAILGLLRKELKIFVQNTAQFSTCFCAN